MEVESYELGEDVDEAGDWGRIGVVAVLLLLMLRA